MPLPYHLISKPKLYFNILHLNWRMLKISIKSEVAAIYKLNKIEVPIEIKTAFKRK